MSNKEGNTTRKSDSGSGEQPDKFPTSRVRIVVNTVDAKSGERKDIELEEAVVVSETHTSYAIQLKKIINTNDDNQGKLEIYGKELQDLLRNLLQDSPYHMFLRDKVTLDSPYEPLILNWDLLSGERNKRGNNENDRLARSDLKLLLQMLQQDSGDPKLDEYFKARESLKNSQSITFDALWTIFHPGTLVYSRPFLKKDQVFIVKGNARTWPQYNKSLRSYLPWELKCWTYDWNGQKFQRRGITLRIDHFTGLKPIAALPVHPLEYTEDVEAVKKRLLERGQLFRKYCTVPEYQRMFKYTGNAVLNKKGARNNSVDNDRDKDELDFLLRRMLTRERLLQSTRHSTVISDVMIDFESYFKYGLASAQIADLRISEDSGECACPDCTSNDALRKRYRTHYDGMRGGKDEIWDDDQTMLCPPRVLGYVLRDKLWGQLDVDAIQEIPATSNNEAFWKKLKLRGRDDGIETKRLLMGLINNHGIGETGGRDSGYQLEDIVPEKGRGLVILFYGPPGVGKTSTAQTIATAARKPLFSIGVADVGTSAELVESNLEKIFDLATVWKAILLIDEADVFLQSRARGHLGPTTERNALVSVFLRVLEYYRGILILTTNQIAQFDVAVQSRIHIALRFRGLDEKQTLQIFQGFLNQCPETLLQPEEKQKIVNWAERYLEKKNFDGRQLRNIITSSIGLARSKNRQLNQDDIMEVVEIMEAFKNDLDYQMKRYKEVQSGQS